VTGCSGGERVKTLASAADKAELLQRLQHVRADSARLWGRMSAPEMVCHVTDSFRMLTGEKEVSHVAHLLNRTVVKWIALYLPAPWPRGRIHTRPEVDPQCRGTRPADFAADVRALEHVVERITALPEAWQGRRHPVFGRLTSSAWLRWGYLHMDHHLRQFGC
jgi:hypothetical protein